MFTEPSLSRVEREYAQERLLTPQEREWLQAEAVRLWLARPPSRRQERKLRVRARVEPRL